MPTTITLEQVKAAAAEVVAEAGENYVYPAEKKKSLLSGLLTMTVCQYVDVDENGRSIQASCIVGRILHKLGVPLHRLREAEGDGAIYLLKRLAYSDEFSPESYVFEDGVAGFLVRLQRLQDSGTAWGVALRTTLGTAE